MIKISNSEINTFLDCPRRWYFQYYLGLSKKSDGSEQVTALTYGTRIHKALEGWYIPDESLRVNPREAIRKIYAEDEANVFAAGGDMDKYREDQKSSLFLIDYYMDKVEKEGFDLGLRYVASEQSYEAQIDDEIIMRGQIDCIVERESDGARWNIDHKTFKSVAPEIQIAHLNTQFLGYMFLYRENNDDYLAGSIMNIFKKVKTTRAKDIIHREYIRHTQLETDNYARRLKVIGNEILKLKNKLDDGADPTTTAYPHVTTNCSWKCPFITVCGMCDDGSDWEGMLNAHFEKYDPNARYEVLK